MSRFFCRAGMFVFELQCIRFICKLDATARTAIAKFCIIHHIKTASIGKNPWAS